MLYDVKVTNPSSESLRLTLSRPELSGLIVRDIQGLGPGKDTLFSRNIVFNLEFLETPSVETNRIKTYKYFPTNSIVRLDITTDQNTFYIYAYVESNEPVMFAEKSGTSVSMLCVDPSFKAINGLQEGSISTTSPLFEFPFSNPTTAAELVFGNAIAAPDSFIIPFDGMIAVEPTLFIHANGGQVVNPKITFYNRINRADVEVLQINTTLADGDYLEIICETKNKQVKHYVAANGTIVSRINSVSLDSNWPVFTSGSNVLSYTATSGGEFITFSYRYECKYAGI